METTIRKASKEGKPDRKPYHPNDFIRQKVSLLRLMPVCVGSIMLAAYFCHSSQSQGEYNCSLIKVDWLDASIVSGWRCIGCLPPALA
jgi:hypothetical protein